MRNIVLVFDIHGHERVSIIELPEMQMKQKVAIVTWLSPRSGVSQEFVCIFLLGISDISAL